MNHLPEKKEVKSLFSIVKEKTTVESTVENNKATVMFSGQIKTQSGQVKSYMPAPIFESAAIRKRIAVNSELVRLKYPNATEEIILNVGEFLNRVNVCKMTDSDVLQWGYECQEKYTTLIENISDIANSSIIKGSKSQINQIGSIIETDFKRPTFWSRFKKQEGSAEEIYQLLTVKTELLKNLLPDLIALLEQIKSKNKDIEILEKEILIECIGGELILDKVTPAHKLVLESRIISLSSMTVQFKVTKQQVSLIEQMLKDIISIIQDTLSVEIPTWYSNKTLVNLNEHQKEELLKKIKI